MHATTWTSTTVVRFVFEAFIAGAFSRSVLAKKVASSSNTSHTCCPSLHTNAKKMMKLVSGGNNGGGRGPIIRMVSNGVEESQTGIDCCFCRCCTCIHLGYLRTLPGIVKVLETVLSGFIQSLLINYGLRYSATIGSAFEGALTTSSACFLTSAVLLACYVISEKSFRLIRASLFEMMFNALSCFLYLSSTVYLAFATKMFLWPMYVIMPGFDVYPAMTAVYLLSGVVGLLHGTDAYFALQHFRSLR